jgi:hypothetical protein
VTKRKRRNQHASVAEAEHEERNGAVSSGPELPEATRERLAELGRLEMDWDSYGALRVAPQALAAAEAIISQAIARTGGRGVPRDIMPIADGGVALEWRGTGIELGLNACPEGGWTALLVERNEGGRRATERYDLTDADALALIFRAIGADAA